MNSDSVNCELMKVVERSVRPVRVDKGRKLRMRQELLAHVTALYEEERARLGDDAAALEAARRRFGDPAELSQELDRSIGFWGRWNWGEERIVDGMDRLLGFRPDRSTAWHFGRALALSLGCGVLVVLLACLVSIANPERNLNWSEAKRLMPVLFYFVGTTFVVHGASLIFVRDFFDVERPRWSRILLHAALCLVAMTVLFYAMWATLADDVSPLLRQAPIVLFVQALIPTGLILAVWSAERHARPYREWTRLRLDE